jgi:tetratricopeptide (TPR) repeat protein
VEIKRVALIFDDVQRPETTGGYCLRALSHLVDVEHFRPDELERVPRTGFDLYLNIDDGLRYHPPGGRIIRRQAEAVKTLGHSLSLRPDHAATHLNLGYALKDSGRIDQAVLAWKQALRLAPNDLAARQELARLDDHREDVGR